MNADDIYEKLEKMHPDARCELNYETQFQFLVAVILSAQCTDKRVNAVVVPLFARCKTAADFNALKAEELEDAIRSCGFYHNKAKSILGAAREVVECYNGELPSDYEAILALPGAGRKTANVVWSELFGGAAVAVDTHVQRVSNRIGLVNSDTPEKTEKQLVALFDKSKLSRLHHLLIFQGRYTCTARAPKCGECLLKAECKYYLNQTAQ
ncbi:MAG: endonuclease III [Clostridiaceae bacterium]|jgi:endonuclease-3|nr:endonuclease III [Clostridiaceae bacterium]